MAARTPNTVDIVVTSATPSFYPLSHPAYPTFGCVTMDGQ